MKSLFPIALLLTGIITFLCFLYPDTMLSPGELSQGHQDLRHDCFSCHAPFRGTPNDRCIRCHALDSIGLDPAGAEPRTAEFHHRLGGVDCRACHTDHRGLEGANLSDGFDHQMLPKGLTDDCTACHAPQKDALHEAVAGSSCRECHGFKSWQDARFRHEILAPGAARQCISCHERPEDRLHRSAQDCATCHGTQAWKPATFEHARYFVLDRDHNVSCDVCHKGGDYGRYTCYGCHEHSPGRILAEHREEGITRSQDDCVACHRSAGEGEHGEGAGRRRGGGEHGEGHDDD